MSLLFSDSTASGLGDPVMIFIQGHAECPDEPTASPVGLEECWSMLFFRQPSSRAYTLPVVRLLTAWYYTRLLITVTPQSVAERTAGSVALPAGALPQGSPELARSWRRAVDAGLTGARELSRYPSCVFAARDVHGGIALARTVAQPAGDGYAVAGEPGR